MARKEIDKRTKVVWTPAADEAFIDLWEEKATELRGPRKNSHIYAEMMQPLAAFVGGIRAIDVKYKIYNFTKTYNKCKEKQGTGCSPTSWKHYERVHRIIGSDRINNVDAVVMDNIRDRPQSVTSPPVTLPSCSINSSIPFPAPPSPAPSSPAVSEASTPVTKTKNHKISELNETIKTAMGENNRLTADLIEIEKKKVAAIETLTQSVVSFLERN